MTFPQYKEWMGENCKLSEAHIEGVREFIEYAELTSKDFPCPCTKCRNEKLLNAEMVELHLLRYGMQQTYTFWKFHGERRIPFVPKHLRTSTQMLHVEEESQGSHTLNDLIAGAFDLHNNESDPNLKSSGDPGVSNSDAAEFVFDDHDYIRLRAEAKRPLYGNCRADITTLYAMVSLHNIKSKFGLSGLSVTEILKWARDLLPQDNTLPDNYPHVKKCLKGLGMKYKSIHACKFDCVLYRKEFELLDECPVCVTYDDWKKVPMDLIDDVWDTVREEFKIPATLKKLVYSKFAEQLKSWRKRLRKKYFNGLDSAFIASLKDKNPKSIQVEAWNVFVQREASKTKLLQRQQAAENRANKTDVHLTGQLSYAQIEQLLICKGLPHSRVDVYLYARKRPDGTYHPIVAAEMERLAQLMKEQGDAHVSLDEDPLSQVHGIEDRPRGLGGKTSRTRALMVEQMLEIQKMKKRKMENKIKNKLKIEKRLDKIEEALFTSSSKVPSSSVDTNLNGRENNSQVPSHTPTHATASGTPSSHTSSQRNFKIRSTSDYGKIVGQGRGSIESTPGVIVHHRPMLAIERKISLNLVYEGMQNEHLYLERQGCATTLGEMEGGFLVWPIYLLEEIQD